MEARRVRQQFPRSSDLPQQSSRYWAKEKDRYLRQLLISDIEEITKRELVVCFCRVDQSIDHNDANDLSEILEGVSADAIDLFLHTSGGYVDAVEKFITVLQYLKPDYRTIVPGWAKSGGTLIALSSKKILLGVTSELGPVDPQITLPDGGVVPAEFLANDEKFKGVYADIAAGMFERSKKLAEKYLKEGMLAGADRKSALELALAKLGSATGYGSHGAVIDFKEAESLGLAVEWMAQEGELWRRVWLLQCLYDADTQRDDLGKIYEGATYSISRKASGN